MALGTVSERPIRKYGEARRWKKKNAAFNKKIACQFTPEQFKQINGYAESMGISFAAGVRHLIFIIGPLGKA